MIRPRLLAGLALALAALGGCDDHDTAKQAQTTEKHMAAPEAAQARYGIGWHAVADTRQSAWGFAVRAVPPLQGRMLASQSNVPEPLRSDAIPTDALSSIRAALMVHMLPARSSVRIEELVNRAIPALEGSRREGAGPTIVLATTPWNDDTLLMWVELQGLNASDDKAITIEFDPAAVAAFRALGDPSALPSPTGGAGNGMQGRAAMLYELLPQAEESPGKAGAPKGNVQFAVLHVGPGAAKLDRPITSADGVGTIDNAPDIVRLATAAAGFGGLLRGDPAMRDLSCNDVIALAQSVRQPDPDGWRAQLVALMYRAQPLIDLPPQDSAGK